MLSAVIPPERSQPAMPLAEQLAHQRFVRPGPLVLGTALLNIPTRTADRDRTVSRRSKPSSRTTLIGEQPNPWDLLQPQDKSSRHRCRFTRITARIGLYLHPAVINAGDWRVVSTDSKPILYLMDGITYGCMSDTSFGTLFFKKRIRLYSLSLLSVAFKPKSLNKRSTSTFWLDASNCCVLRYTSDSLHQLPSSINHTAKLKVLSERSSGIILVLFL